MMYLVLLLIVVADLVQCSPTRLLVIRNPSRATEEENAYRAAPVPSNLLVLTDDNPVPNYLRDYSVIPLNGPRNPGERLRMRRRRIRINDSVPTSPDAGGLDNSDEDNSEQRLNNPESANFVYPVAIPLGEYPPGWRPGLPVPMSPAIIPLPGGGLPYGSRRIVQTVQRSDDAVLVRTSGSIDPIPNSVPEDVIETQPVDPENLVLTPPPDVLNENFDPTSSSELGVSENAVEISDGTNPSPYLFGYIVNDGQGSIQHRQESANDDGVVTGSYGYRDSFGLYRIVNYIADSNGFRVKINSNEPGMDLHSSDTVTANTLASISQESS